MKKEKYTKEYTVWEMLLELRKLRTIELEKGQILSELSKQKREILKALKLSIPVKPSY